MNEAWRRLSILIGAGLVASSAVFIGLWSMFFVSAVNAWAYLGQWPRYGHPDPKDLPASVIDRGEVWERAVFPLVMIFAAAIFAFLHRSSQRPARILLHAAGLAVLIASAGYGLFWLDPFGVFEWGID